MNLGNLFIFYPSLRFFLSAKIAGIKKIYKYPFFSKRNLHLVKTAKKFTEECLKMNDCPTETKIYINSKKIKNFKKKEKKIILGIGSSGPTTKWGYENYIKLIKRLNENNKYYFYLLCGPDENDDAEKIIKNLGEDCCESLSNKNITEVRDYIFFSDIYIGNDSFGHHISCQMGKPSFIILLDTPRAYSDYSINQHRILPPNVSIDEVTHDSKFDPSSITEEMILEKVKKFI